MHPSGEKFENILLSVDPMSAHSENADIVGDYQFNLLDLEKTPECADDRDALLGGKDTAYQWKVVSGGVCGASRPRPCISLSNSFAPLGVEVNVLSLSLSEVPNAEVDIKNSMLTDNAAALQAANNMVATVRAETHGSRNDHKDDSVEQLSMFVQSHDNHICIDDMKSHVHILFGAIANRIIICWQILLAASCMHWSIQWFSYCTNQSKSNCCKQRRGVLRLKGGGGSKKVKTTQSK